jgi:hypothetical protein
MDKKSFVTLAQVIMLTVGYCDEIIGAVRAAKKAGIPVG